MSTWGDVAADRNHRDIGDYPDDFYDDRGRWDYDRDDYDLRDRGDVKSSIWDRDGHAPYDQDYQDRIDEEKRRQAEEDEANRDTGWFGDKTRDVLGDPWRGAQGRYPGGPDDPYGRRSQSRDRVKRGSSVRVDRFARSRRARRRRMHQAGWYQPRDAWRAAKKSKRKITKRGFWF